MRRIPKSFQLGGFTFTVEMVDEEEMAKIVGDGTDAYGCFQPERLAIYLRKPTRKLKRSVVLQTFWHEYAHAHLWVQGDPRWSNENYVEHMGHLLHQAHQTMTF